MLLQLATRWSGPLVAAATHEPDASLPALPPYLSSKVTLLLASRVRGEPFPINALRNKALAAVATSHFMVLDVDLWPCPQLLNELRALDPAWLDGSTPRVAILVPAFQLTAAPGSVTEALAAGQDPLPPDVPALRRCVQRGACTAFKGQLMEGGVHAIPGQQLATDYARWFASERRALPYRIPCFDKPSFEPYLIVRTGSTTPPFDETFVGYGKNKVQWVQALRAAGYAFWVLPRGFVTHVPHAVTRSGREWSHNVGGHKQKMDALFEAQLAKAAAAEEADAARERTRGGAGERAGLTSAARCRRTPACKVPLAQFIDPLNVQNAGRRVIAEILA